MEPKPTNRQAVYRSKGRQIAAVITDPDAIKALDRLAEKTGGVKAAITHALLRCK